MQKENLPFTIDPFRSAGRLLSYGGFLQLSGMTRLTSGLAAQQGNVQVKIECSIDAEGIHYLKGSLNTSLDLQCQRCLELYGHEINSEFLLGLVRSPEESERLPSHYEPWIVEGNNLVVSDMIEEELIISLPVAPMHLPSNCGIQLKDFSAEHVDIKVKNESNPFKSIKSLYSSEDLQD